MPDLPVQKTPEIDASTQEPANLSQPPPFTLRNVLGDIYTGLSALFMDPFLNRLVVPTLVPIASILCKVVVAKVKYTEIDFSTYMQQIELVNSGQLDYSKITGDTGPMVYPAGHVQVYQFLYWLTEEGVYIGRAQIAFGYLFTATVLMSCVVYTMLPRFPPWPLYLLLCSKRLLSIYVLRLFNDCFTTAAMVGVVLLLQQGSYWYKTMGEKYIWLLCAVAADLFSMAISVKMNALLYLPAFMVVVYFLVGERLLSFLGVLLVIPLVQLMVGWRFLLPLFYDEEANTLRWTYINQAFDFQRKFLYEWTVNWRFIPEETFLSDSFANALLIGHVSVLAVFAFTRYLSPRVTGKPISGLLKDGLRPFTKTVSNSNLLLDQEAGPKLVLLIFSTTNLVGVLFARSLHYQFLSWYCWLLPFMLYAAGLSPVVGGLVFLIHEWCWNVYPSTNASSLVLVVTLAAILAAVWSNSSVWFEVPTRKPTAESTRKPTAES